MYGQLSPLILAMKLVGAQATPGQACARCQGSNLDCSLATMCPQCQSILTSPVLRACAVASCNYTFAAPPSDRKKWRSLPDDLFAELHLLSEPAQVRRRVAETSFAMDSNLLQQSGTLAEPKLPGGDEEKLPSMTQDGASFTRAATSTPTASRQIEQIQDACTVSDEPSFSDTAPVTTGPPPGWYPDPTGRYEWRWFDGQWTNHVSSRGSAEVDSLWEEV